MTAPMRLVLIHGPPAAGKLTVGRELAAPAGAPLVDNHAAIDLARMVLPFDAPGFWEFVHELRLTTLRGAARAGVPLLITTSAYNHPEDEPLLRDYERAVGEHGGRLAPVHLSCSEETLLARVSDPERVRRRKLATSEALRRFLEGRTYAPVPREGWLRLSTETAPPTETAAAIASHLGLWAAEQG